MKKITTRSDADTKKLAREIGQELKGGQILALAGELGAGKTTFTQGLAEYFEIKNIITSPTFVIIEENVIKEQKAKIRNSKQSQNSKFKIQNFIHIDCYRLNNPDELLELGFNEYLVRKDVVVVIEWADKVKKILPPETRWITFEHGNNENERLIKY